MNRFFWSRYKLVIVIAFFLTFGFFSASKASLNEQINYQGKLTDTSNNPVADGDYNLKFQLCADSGCSSVLWTETRTSTNKVAVSNGLFSVLLGSVSSLSSVDFNQSIYLEVSVGGTGVPSWEVLLPRKLLGAVPSALEAKKLSGKTVDDFAQLAENENVSGVWNFSSILSITANSVSPALTVLQTGFGNGIDIGDGVATTSISADGIMVEGNIDVTGYFSVNGANVSQYFINSDGTPGSVWMASGGGVGHWATTSSLGFGSSSLPSGSTGQTLAYGSSGWEATSTLYVIGTSLFNATTTFGSSVISEDGMFVSGVASGNSGSVELLSNTGFESSASSISPWSVMATSGSASYNISTSSPSPYAGNNHLILYSGAMSNYAVLGQTGLSNPGSTAMTVSFYGVGEVGGEKLRIALIGDNCGDGSWTYNFTMFSWDCVNFNGASYSLYAKDFTMTAAYAPYSVTFTSLPAASSTSGLTIDVMVGSSDPGTYHGQNIAVDNFSLSYYNASVSTAFILNASSFSATSTNDTLLSVRSNGTEKLNLTSDGDLTLSGDLDVTGVFVMNGTNVGQYFISSAGTSGYLWQSDGSGAGTWISTSSLGILPSGSSNQTLSYGASGWEATSSLQLSYLSVQNKAGIGTSAPSAVQLEVMSNAVGQLKLSYDSSNFATFEVDSSGFLNLTPSSTASSFTDGFNLSWPPNGWTTGGSANWQQSVVSTQEGIGAAQSGTITDNQSTWIDIDVETASGNVTFWWKASSEANYDYLQFCYDSDLTCSRTSGSIAGISGNQDWVQVTYAVTAGTHSFRWLYAKDTSAANGSDAGYIDNVTFPTVGGQTSLVVNSNGSFTGKLLVGTTTEFVSSNGYQLQVDSGSVDGDGIAVNGHIIASSYITGTTTVDLAESYPVLADCKLDNSCPEPGDVVCSNYTSSSYYIEKCTKSSSRKVLGVITTNPGFVLGGRSDDLLIDSQDFISRAVALAGRVPVKISMPTGTIEVGDEITVSDIPGFATKAIEPGRVMGTALLPFNPLISGATGTLEIFVNPHWSIGNIEEKDIPVDLPDFSSTSTPTILDKFTLTIENSLQKLGMVIKNGVAKLKELFVDKIFVRQLCVGETCIGEQQLKDLLEKNQVTRLQIIEAGSSTTMNDSAVSSSDVIFSDSTSSFSVFSSSTEVVNSSNNPSVSEPVSTNIISPELAPNTENILPPIFTNVEAVSTETTIQASAPQSSPASAVSAPVLSETNN